MKSIFLCLFIVILSYSNAASINSDDEMPVEQWKAYKIDHEKKYDEAEDAERFEIFKATLKTIEEHNKKYEKGEVSYTMGLNKFSDWKAEEKQSLHGLRAPPSGEAAQ